MAVKTDEIRSADDLVISSAKELMTGGHPWDADRVYQKETLCTINDPSFHNQLAHKQYFSLTDNNIGNDPLTNTVNWVEDNVVKYLNEDLVVTVGTSGDFASLNDALLFLGRFAAVDGASIDIKILSGHVINYHIYINSMSLPNVTVNAEDAIVEISDDAGISNHIMYFVQTVGLTLDFNMNFTGNYGSATQSCLNLYNSSINIYGNITNNYTGTNAINTIQLVGNSYLFAPNLTIDGGQNCLHLSGNCTAQLNGFIAKNFKKYDAGRNSYGVSVRQASKIDFPGNTNIREKTGGPSDGAIICTDSSTINIKTSDCRRKNGAVTSGTSGADIQVHSGGIIGLFSTTGGTNITTNTITSNGIIFNN